MTRTLTTDTYSEYERVVDEKATAGYSIVSEGDTSTRLRKRDHGTLGGHLLVFLITVWFTLGLGNVVYALYRRSATTDEVLVRLEGER